MDSSIAIRMVNITKTFGEVVANNKVCLDIQRGEILSLLGENGSGKTTLMNMLAGIYFPDSGEIIINGKPVTIASPKDAFDLHIGMIHQHFKLVDVLSASENIILGLNESAIVDVKRVRESVKQICDRYGFVVDPDKKVYDMSVSEKQTLEIVKVLYRGADILILDEPTAVLTPQETQKLFCVMRNMKDDGKSIIIITHKLHEVMEISDRVAVLRKGQYIGDVPTSETNAMKLTEMMVGRAVSLDIGRIDPVDPKPRLVVKNLNVCDKEGVNRLSDVNFTAYSGEILGVAGISGSGQKELLEAIAGLQNCRDCSSMEFISDKGEKKQLSGMHPLEIKNLGVTLAFVPEDRLGMGLVGSMNLTDNMMLRSYRDGKGMLADRKAPKKLAESVVRDLEVVTPSINTPVRRLSGGNVQKVLVGREIAMQPQILMSAYAVRGLDINTSYNIYHLLGEQKKRGAAVIFVGEDLDVLLELCDRIMVLCSGRVNDIVDPRTTTKDEVGYLMTYLKEGGTNRE